MDMVGCNQIGNETGDDRRGQVTDKLQRREEQRQQEILSRRAEKEQNVSSIEQVDVFQTRFSVLCTAVKCKLDAASTLSVQGKTAHFDDISRDLHALHKYVADATLFLPAYDVRRAQDILTLLQSDYEQALEKNIPRKKFAFRSKKVKPAVQSEKPSTSIKGSDIPDGARLSVGSSFACTVRNRQLATVCLTAQEVTDKDVLISELDTCTVHITGSPGTLHVAGLKNCQILCGPVSTSVFVENCTDCTFAFACQQLRTHTTSQSDFYLHVTSCMIVEDCKKIRVAPYSWSYDSLDDDFRQAKLDRDINNWREVADFNWLSNDQPSPNWSIIPVEERATLV